MIKSWSLAHFKSVCDPISLEMAPLTVFAGANSSGKSTLIQSLLLTAQTIQGRVASRPVVLNGHILRLGAFSDILSNECTSDEITIGFTLLPTLDARDPDQQVAWQYFYIGGQPLAEGSSISCRFSFSAGKAGAPDGKLQLQPRLESTHLYVEVVATDGTKRNTTLELLRSNKSMEERRQAYSLPDTEKVGTLRALEYEVATAPQPENAPWYPRLPESGIAVGAAMDHFLPASLAVRFDSIEENAAATYEQLLPPPARQRRGFTEFQELPIAPRASSVFLRAVDEAIAPRLPSLSPNIRNKLQALRNVFSWQDLQELYRVTPASLDTVIAQGVAGVRDELISAIRAGRRAEYALTFTPLPSLVELGRHQIRQYFTQYLRYLGPLRDQPKPIYPLAGAAEMKDIGLTGEHTAAVLDLHRNTQIEYVPSSAFSPNGRMHTRRTTLIAAALDWLEYMGVASEVTTTDLGKLGHELKVVPTGSRASRDLTHVGVGVSQVLPILVLCLLADRGSTLILEQPELHLHPRVQTRLADFFLSMTYVAKQCIVETHSEYLINRLRMQAVSAPDSSVANAITVYFVEPRAGRSTYRPISIDEFGVIAEWPAGFFDEAETLAEGILRAAMKKREVRHSRNDG